MQITEVNVTPINNEKKLKGFASIVFDNCFVVSDIKIIETPRAAFLSMPSKKASNGKFRDVAHPLNAETRRMIEDHVFDAYEDLTGQKLCRESNEGAFEADTAIDSADREMEADAGIGSTDREMEAETVQSTFEEGPNEEVEEEREVRTSDILSVKEFGY